jgi:hypothetical protein
MQRGNLCLRTYTPYGKYMKERALRMTHSTGKSCLLGAKRWHCYSMSSQTLAGRSLTPWPRMLRVGGWVCSRSFLRELLMKDVHKGRAMDARRRN